MIYRDSLNAPFRPIGVIDIPAGEVTDRGYETASWWRQIEYPAQRAVVVSNGYYVSYGVTGTVTDEYFGRYGGEKRTGVEARYTFQPYAHSFAERAVSGIDGFTFLPGYGADCAPYDHDPSKLGYFLTMPDEGHSLVLERERGEPFADIDTYAVTWNGEKQAPVEVSRIRGFNGDTRHVAHADAVRALNLV